MISAVASVAKKRFSDHCGLYGHNSSEMEEKKKKVLGPNFCSCSNYTRSEFGKALCLNVCARTLATQARKREAFPLIFLPSLLELTLHFSY